MQELLEIWYLHNTLWHRGAGFYFKSTQSEPEAPEAAEPASQSDNNIGIIIYEKLLWSGHW